ncbi:MAG TPA: CDP-alcohol phosphatidyltransferase family protein [Candidatus Nanopelagicales bacterium]
MDQATYLERWSALHGGTAPAGVVGGWLRIVHATATPFVRLRVPPDVVTLLGLLVAALAPWLAGQGRAGLVAAAGVIVASGLVDSLDGAVAVMTDRVTRWGAVLDAVVDRVSDAVIVGALWVAGAPPALCVAGVAVGWLHEYLRARAGAAGMAGVGRITVAERPTRIIVVVMSLLAAATRPDDERWAWFGALLLLVVGLVGFVQLVLVVRRALAAGPG